MRCAIMQPTYFPWAGYLNLIDKVDVFVFLDDAQYERSSWHNRNRILFNGVPHWLSVPVLRRHLGEPLNSVVTDERQHWRRKHVASLRHAYSKHPHLDDILELSVTIASDVAETLADMNVRLISECCRKLSIDTPVRRASEIGVVGSRTGRLLAICNALQCDEYWSPPGAMAYLEADGFARMADVELKINQFIPSPYLQLGAQLIVSHLSIIDVIANVGWTGAEVYVKNGAGN